KFNIDVKLIENDYLMNNVFISEKEEVIDEEINEEITILFEPTNLQPEILSKLEYYLDNFNLSVSTIDIKGNTVIFNISDFKIICNVNTNKGVLELLTLDSGTIGSTNSFEPGFNFTFIPSQVFSNELHGTKKSLLNFIEFANNQAHYIQFSNDNNNL